MDRLEALADVGQCAADDDRHRVVDVRAAHLIFECARLDVAAGELAGAHQMSTRRGERVVLDEGPPRLDLVTHQHREDPVGRGRVLHRHLRERPRRRVHRRLPQLFGVHLAQALEALQRDALLGDARTASRSSSNEVACLDSAPSRTVNVGSPAISTSWPRTRINERYSSEANSERAMRCVRASPVRVSTALTTISLVVLG